ncbi:hypothetical protein PV08_10220 [Exophiala spinifera]|uniref:VOC domain-containing protein n=1 Tax=Exophiala spinifera TaxID=91928 RepID=A0A0D1Y7M6_9EURO|nr:uncharacterized protein PV08_10220 [Exophiala spinifera]KIW10921.1 hypothetical protein PV08_10220 [Exophiala spinifera]
MSTSKVRVIRLAHVVYQHPDLDRALKFLFDFGLVEEHRTDTRVYLRGYGVQPFIYVAEKSPDSKRHFLGGFWAVESEEEFKKAASKPNASSVQNIDGPGGGKFVTIDDPHGFKVGFVYGQKLRKADRPPPLEKTEPVFNGAEEKPRLGAWRRFQRGASPVHKLGHYGFMVPASTFESSRDWYTDLMNLKASDAVFDPRTGKDETCFLHIDLGSEYTDHHSIFFAAAPEEAPAHVHHSSYEVDNFDTETIGHDWLRSKGWTNCWGIGRHVLGSQIFDYWFDGSGNIVEHYSDGDLVNEDTLMTRNPAAPDTLHVWGPNIPLAFATGRIEDAGKELPMPPDVLEGRPAKLPLPVVAS